MSAPTAARDVRAVRPLMRGWQTDTRRVSADAIRGARARLERDAVRFDAVLVRPEDARALGVLAIDGLPLEPDDCVPQGCVFFVLTEGATR